MDLQHALLESKGNFNSFKRKLDSTLIAELCKITSFLDSFNPTLNQRVFHFVHKINEPMRCVHCNEPTIWRSHDSLHCTIIWARGKNYHKFCLKSECQAEKNKRRWKKQWESMDDEKRLLRKERWIKSKIASNLREFGTEWHSQTIDWQEKVKDTSRAKFGADWYMQTEKFDSVRQKFVFNWKSYVLPSGKEVKVQGYEDRILPILIQKFGENDLAISNDEIESCLGKIHYVGKDGKTHRYIPDIYVKSENLIIEVKSPWTYEVQRETNLLKADACKNKGINFKFVLIDSKGNMNEIYH